MYVKIIPIGGRSPACHANKLVALRAGQLKLKYMYFTYVLESQKDHQRYTGWTDDLRNRLNAHNTGKVESTKLRRPFVLIYYEACTNKEKAIKREKYLKSGFGRKYLKDRV